MSDTMHVDPVTLVILTALFSGAIGGMFPAFWSAIINRGVEQKASSRVENESQKVAPRGGCKPWFTKI